MKAVLFRMEEHPNHLSDMDGPSRLKPDNERDPQRVERPRSVLAHFDASDLSEITSARILTIRTGRSCELQHIHTMRLGLLFAAIFLPCVFGQLSEAEQDIINQELRDAAGAGDRARCKTLLDNGATHAANEWGETPLSIAARSGHVGVCTDLLDRGATQVARKDGSTPLFVAALGGHLETCRTLLTRGATHATNAYGWTPLYVAAWYGYQTVCTLLLDNGATHVANEWGATPLYIAAMNGRHAICTLLLNRGATHAPDKYGWTPLRVAAMSGHREVCKLLKDRGANLNAEIEWFQRNLWTATVTMLRGL